MEARLIDELRRDARDRELWDSRSVEQRHRAVGDRLMRQVEDEALQDVREDTDALIAQREKVEARIQELLSTVSPQAVAAAAPAPAVGPTREQFKVTNYDNEVVEIIRNPTQDDVRTLIAAADDGATALHYFRDDVGDVYAWSAGKLSDSEFEVQLHEIGAVLPREPGTESYETFRKGQRIDDVFFQGGTSPAGRRVVRGWTVFERDDSERVVKTFVRLTEAADFSTMVHEGAHVFLEMIQDLATQPNATPEIRALWADIMDWFGLDGDNRPGTPEHELFARTFEAYLRDGKAPTLSLRRIFHQFMVWLTDIYRAMVPGSRLDDAARSIFDRILASEAAIAEARASTGADAGFFRDRHEAGMSEQQWARYLEQRDNARRESADAVRVAAMEALFRERTAAWNRELAHARTKAAAQVDAEPVRRAHDWLAYGKWRGEVERVGKRGDELEPGWGFVDPPADLPFMRLNLPAIVDHFGIEALRALPAAVRPMDGVDEAQVDQLVEAAKRARTSRSSRAPTRLASFVHAMGGVTDEGGDVLALLGGSHKTRPGLISKKGRSLDDMALLAWESGFFGAKPTKGGSAVFQMEEHIPAGVRLENVRITPAAPGAQPRLGQMIQLQKGMKDADFWIVRRGTPEAVGSVTREFNPEHYGVKVTARDHLHPDYLYYALMWVHTQGAYQSLARGTTRLVNIRRSDVLELPVGNATEATPEARAGDAPGAGRIDPREPLRISHFFQADDSTPLFQRWFRQSQVVDDDGAPLVVYYGAEVAPLEFAENTAEHTFGRTHTFYGSAKMANRQMHLPEAFDDLMNEMREARVADARAASNVVNMRRQVVADVSTISADVADELGASDGALMPVYLSMQKPVVLGGENETVLSYEGAANVVRFAANEAPAVARGELIDFIAALRQEALAFEGDRSALEGMIQRIIAKAGKNNNRITARELYDVFEAEQRRIWKASERAYVAWEKANPDADMLRVTALTGKTQAERDKAARALRDIPPAPDRSENTGINSFRYNGARPFYGAWKEIVRLAFARLGYDGIINHTAPRFKKNEGLSKKRTISTYHPFRADQIKSAIGNVGTFDPRSANILYQEDVVDDREARAVEQGYTTIAFRGFRRPVDEGRGEVWFFSAGKTAANSFADRGGDAEIDGPGERAPNVLRARLRLGRTLRVDASGSEWWNIPLAGVLDNEAQRALQERAAGLGVTGTLTHADTDDLVVVAKALGYDSLTLESVREGAQLAPDVVFVVFDKANVRAAHAAFAPSGVGRVGLLLQEDTDGRPTVRQFLDALRDDLNNEPVYRLEEQEEVWLRAQDRDMEEWFARRDIDINAKVADLREQIILALQREVTGEDAYHPDVVARAFGFDSGDALLRALAAMTPRAEAIERAAQAIVRAEHGDPVADGTLQQEALDAAHHAAQARVIEIELEALSRATGGLTRPLVRAARKVAEARIAKLPLSRVKAYDHWIMQERRHARLAYEAMQRGETTIALMEKRAQLVAFQMWRVSRMAAREIDKAEALFKSFDKARVRQRLDPTIRDQIDQLLERFALRRQSVAGEGKRPSLASWVADMRALKLDHLLMIDDRLIDDTRPRLFLQLTWDELQGLRDTVQNLAHLARHRNDMLVERERQTIEAVENAIVARIEETGDISPDKREGINATPLESVGEWFKKAHASLVKAEVLFRTLDGTEDNGPVWRHLFRPLAEADDTEKEMQSLAAARLVEIFEGYTDKERAAMYTARHQTAGIGIPTTKIERMMIALNWGNEGNRTALMAGYQWSPEQVEKVLDTLDARDWAVVQSIWDWLEEYRKPAFDLHERLTGVRPQAVEPSPVRTAYGVFRGGYFPLRYNREVSQRAFQNEERTHTLEELGANWVRPMTRQGHLRERTNSAGQPILLSMSVLQDHVGNVIHDLTHREAIIDTLRLIERPAIQAAITKSVGLPLYQTLRPWLTHIAVPPRGPEDFFGQAMELLARNTAVVAMGWKISTAVVQPLGVMNAIPRVGEARMAKTLGRFMTIEAPALYEEALAKSTELRFRRETWDRDARAAQATIRGRHPGDPVPIGVRRSFFALTGYADLLSSGVIWTAAYDAARAGEVDNVAAQDEAAAIQHANSVVRTTQGSGSVKDTAALLRQRGLMRAFTMFQTFFNTLFNQLWETNVGFRQQRISRMQLARNVFWLWFAGAFFAELLQGKVAPDDDEDWAAVFVRLARTIAVYPLMAIPGLRDVMNAVGTDYGYEVTPIGDAGKALTSLINDTGEGDFDEATVKNTVRVLGYAFGLPAGQINITGDYAVDVATGGESPIEDPLGLYSEALVRDRR